MSVPYLEQEYVPHAKDNRERHVVGEYGDEPLRGEHDAAHLFAFLRRRTGTENIRECRHLTRGMRTRCLAISGMKDMSRLSRM